MKANGEVWLKIILRKLMIFNTYPMIMMNKISNHLEIQNNQQKNQNKHNLVISPSSQKKKKQKLDLDQWLETGLSVPEKIYIPTNIIRQNDLKTK